MAHPRDLRTAALAGLGMPLKPGLFMAIPA